MLRVIAAAALVGFSLCFGLVGCRWSEFAESYGSSRILSRFLFDQITNHYSLDLISLNFSLLILEF